ncbi:MAG: 16S rRNA (cytidine(1402)-2'-O)-methyltransferase [Gammaproteobacteria bacterium]|nr:16S rRNA (cytidine(1402)-2'-O)-methyltransferase [Gammaproteobacteria bacterium]
MPGVLYIVATPIGNLQDMSLRAIDTLGSVDLIAAEDTRHSARLLDHFGIDTPMLSLHDHNERRRGAEIIARLEQGMSVALISDAGTPLISDPGFDLVRRAHVAGITVSPIPGASSIAAALSAAGLPSDGFRFQGFLPSKGRERRQRLLELLENRTTLVLFEATHRILDLLQLLVDEAPDRDVVVAKELTKRHERFLRGQAADLLAEMRAEPALARGEFVVLIDNAARAEDKAVNTEDARLLAILCAELPVKSATKIAALITGKSKNELYSLALEASGKRPSR